MPANPSTPNPIPSDPGLPLLGHALSTVTETLEFLRGWQPYFLARRARHGGVFRTNIGAPAITLLDPVAVGAALDVTKVRKRYGFGPRKPRPALVGDIVPVMFSNDAEHDQLKGMVLTLMRRRFGLLSGIYAEIAPAWRARLMAAGPCDGAQAIEDLLADLVFRWLLGLEKGPSAADLRGWLDTLLAPRFAPWPTATDRVMAGSYARLVTLARASPVVVDLPDADLQAAGVDRDQLARHLLFVAGFNAWSGLRGLLASMAAELSTWSDEARAAARTTADPWRPTGENAALQRIVLETLRLHPPAPIVFGEARADFALPTSTGTVEVKAGELLMSVLSLAQRDPSLGDPDVFRPDRFADPTLAARSLYWAGGPDGVPTGATNTVCPGQDVVPAIARAFCADWLTLDVAVAEPPRWSTITMVQANRPENGLRLTRVSART